MGYGFPHDEHPLCANFVLDSRCNEQDSCASFFGGSSGTGTYFKVKPCGCKWWLGTGREWRESDRTVCEGFSEEVSYSIEQLWKGSCAHQEHRAFYASEGSDVEGSRREAGRRAGLCQAGAGSQ